MGSHLIVSIDDVGTPGIPSYAAEEGVTHVPAMPNLAKLEALGVRFARAYANTVCGPTRMLMYTGKYGFSSGVGSNVSLATASPPLATDVMLPELLTSHASGMFGKWHLGTASNDGNNSPGKVGKFDDFEGLISNISAVATDTYWYWTKTTQVGTADATQATVGGKTRTGINSLPGGAGTAIFQKATLGGSWISNGYAVGDYVYGLGFGSSNAAEDGNGRWPVSAVTATDLTVTDAGDTITGDSGATGAIQNRTADNYQAKQTTAAANAWLTANAGSDWLCYVNHQLPHAPLHQPNTAVERANDSLPAHMSALMEAVTEAYTKIALGDDVAANTAYLEGLNPPWIVGGDDDESLVAFNIAMIEAWDYELGVLLDHAEVSGGGFTSDGPINSDVTVWFFSDNGPFSGVVQQPFDPNHAKQTQYELAVRVPFTVAGNGIATSEKGKTCRRLVHVADMVPTILAMESVSIPAGLNGVDVSRYFTNAETRDRARDYAYSENFQPNCAGGIANSATGATNDPAFPLITQWERAIQDEGWKLITKMPTGPASTTGDITYELYNIKGGDRQETENLIRDNLLTLAGVNHSVEAYNALQRLLTAEAALLP